MHTCKYVHMYVYLNYHSFCENKICQIIQLTFNPSAIYSESIEPLYVLHSRFPTKQSWVVAYLKFITIFLRIFQKKF
jgi:hypothetical protein